MHPKKDASPVFMYDLGYLLIRYSRFQEGFQPERFPMICFP